MTIIENSLSTIHLLQKGTSWAYWDPLRPSLDGFHRIVGFFFIHQLFLWPLIPLVSFCQLFKSPLVVQCCNVICEWPLIRVIAVTRGVINRGQPHDPGTWVASPTRRLVQPTIFRNIFMGTRMPAKGEKRVMARLYIMYTILLFWIANISWSHIAVMYNRVVFGPIICMVF